MTPSDAINARVFGVSACFGLCPRAPLPALPSPKPFAVFRAPSGAGTVIVTGRDSHSQNRNGPDVDVVQSATSTVTP